MDILAWIGTRYQAVVENCVLSYIFLHIYAHALIFKNVQLNEKCLLARRAYYSTK